MFHEKPKLVSFDVCPFVQRTRILMAMKAVPHEVVAIDLNAKPAWFMSRVPTGQVPALLVGDDTLFESAVINEFIDEITPGSALPSEPVARARARAWIKQSDALIFDQYRMLAAKTEDAYTGARTEFENAFAKFTAVADRQSDIHSELGATSMVDISIAPVFTRLSTLERLKAAPPLNLPNAIVDWGTRILSVPEVAASTAENFDAQMTRFFRRRGSHVFARAHVETLPDGKNAG